MGKKAMTRPTPLASLIARMHRILSSDLADDEQIGFIIATRHWLEELESALSLLPPAQGWEPLTTRPDRDVEAFWWIVPKTPDEAFVNTSGDPIFGTHKPYIHRGKWHTWGSLSKAIYWHPMLAPPLPVDRETPEA